MMKNAFRCFQIFLLLFGKWMISVDSGVVTLGVAKKVPLSGWGDMERPVSRSHIA